jgi:hypothetical protein
VSSNIGVDVSLVVLYFWGCVRDDCYAHVLCGVNADLLVDLLYELFFSYFFTAFYMH